MCDVSRHTHLPFYNQRPALLTSYQRACSICLYQDRWHLKTKHSHSSIHSSLNQFRVFLISFIQTTELFNHFFIGLQPELTSVFILDHGTLLGESEVKPITGLDSKRVTYFLGVPYARPPIGELRFSPPQPADWTGTWNATFSRCVDILIADCESINVCSHTFIPSDWPVVFAELIITFLERDLIRLIKTVLDPVVFSLVTPLTPPPVKTVFISMCLLLVVW